MPKFLCTADIHIGRCSAVGGTPDPRHDHSALAAWGRVVDAALDGQADALLIAGDFYDSLPAQYESRRQVKASLERLKAKGIAVLAITGNHDHHALPEFARLHSDLIRLFPPDQWTDAEVAGIRIMGRSFPGEYHRDSMLRGFPPPADGKPTIGLVHADIDGQGSYGPTPADHFRTPGVLAWVVGHIHLPQSLLAGRVLYPGSPQALDWGETGRHGVRWLEVDHGTARFGDLCPLSTVHYEPLSVRLGSSDSLDECLQARSAALQQENSRLQSVQFRVALQLDAGDARPFPEAAALDDDWYAVCSRTVVPTMNLEEEARQSDAKGQAARLLLGLDGQGEPAWKTSVDRLVQRVHQQMSAERHSQKLPPTESVQVLRQATVADASQAIRRALERVLMADEGAS